MILNIARCPRCRGSSFSVEGNLHKTQRPN
jgi:hypothetical protein